MKSVALVGLSGTGKSTVGRALAVQRGWPLRDTDALIVQAAGRSAAQIFAAEGEARFREREAEALRAALGGEPSIIATGAGIVLHAENRRRLREHCVVVWLDAPDDIIIARLRAHDEQRPLLSGDATAKLKALRTARATLYAEIAHARVETTTFTVDEIAENILSLLPVGLFAQISV